MLFSYKDIESTKEIEKKSTQPSAASATVENKFVMGVAGSLLSELIPSLTKGEAIHIPSYGNWSFNHMISHVLKLTGPAKVFLTSWTISEQPVKELLQLLDSGRITELHALLDSRVRINCPNAYQIAQHRFVNMKLCHIHAKLAIIINDDYQITINSSANLSRNPTIECYVITESNAIASFHKGWILEQINESLPFQK